jgi:hypothetical protein
VQNIHLQELQNKTKQASFLAFLQELPESEYGMEVGLSFSKV